MKTIIGIDPGLRGCGVSVVRDGKVVAAAYVKNTDQTHRGPRAWVSMAHEVEMFVKENVPDGELIMVQELMKVYPRQKGDPADLLELQGVNGAIVGRIRCDQQIGYTAREWKGQVPKEVHNARVELKLTSEESAVITTTKSLRHNVIDAIGIALHYIGR